MSYIAEAPRAESLFDTVRPEMDGAGWATAQRGKEGKEHQQSQIPEHHTVMTASSIPHAKPLIETSNLSPALPRIGRANGHRRATSTISGIHYLNSGLSHSLRAEAAASTSLPMAGMVYRSPSIDLIALPTSLSPFTRRELLHRLNSDVDSILEPLDLDTVGNTRS